MIRSHPPWSEDANRTWRHARVKSEGPQLFCSFGQLDIVPAEKLRPIHRKAEVVALDLGRNRVGLLARGVVGGLGRYLHPALGRFAHAGDDELQSVREARHHAARIIGGLEKLRSILAFKMRQPIARRRGWHA